MDISCRKLPSLSGFQAQFKLPLSEIWGSGSNLVWTVGQMVLADRKGSVIWGQGQGQEAGGRRQEAGGRVVRLLSPRLAG